MGEKKGPSRRDIIRIVPAVVGGIVVGTAAGWLAKPEAPGRETTITETVTVGERTVFTTVTDVQTVTKTETVRVAPEMPVFTRSTPATRALEAAVRYIKENNIPAGTKLVVLASSGTEGHYRKKWLEEWEKVTGIEIEGLFVALPDVFSKAIAESVTRAGAYDVAFLGTAVGFADLVEAGVVHDIEPLINKYDPEIFTGICPWPDIFHNSMAVYRGKTQAFIPDYNVWLMLYNKKYYEDKDNQRAFEDEFGYPLAPPRTWKEVHDQARFFYEPEKNQYGWYDFKSPFWNWLSFATRWLSTGIPYFDKDLNPLVDRPEVLQALNDSIALQEYLPEEVWTGDFMTMYTLFIEGKLAALLTWTSLKKFAENPQVSKVAGSVGYALTPGYEAAPGVIRHIGFSAVNHPAYVNTYSKHPELAYLFLQWYFSPEISTGWVTDEAGFYEPFRACHMTNRDVAATWGAGVDDGLAFQSLMLENFNWFAPDLYLPGGFEFQEIADKNLVDAYTGRKSPESALKDIASAWKDIIERVGRDKIHAQWTHLRKNAWGRSLRPLMRFLE